jgi:8-oxo-dGTP pyrophosphatase MutT (NUDIX family)
VPDATPDPPAETPRALVPAATVVLLRDGDEGLETLLLRRNSRLAFAGGHWVFPGGRMEPSDLASADLATAFAGLADGDVDRVIDDPALTGAARRAAVRETQEETGLVLDEDTLVWFAHWTPPPSGPRRFATWFFVTTAPEGAVLVDGGEIHDHVWLRPAEAHRRRDAGAIELSPPTWVSLWQLLPFATTAEALAALAGQTPGRYTTRIVPAGGPPAPDRPVTEDHLVAMWLGDAGYPDSDATRPGPRHRLEMHPGGWRYQRHHLPS